MHAYKIIFTHKYNFNTNLHNALKQITIQQILSYPNPNVSQVHNYNCGCTACVRHDETHYLSQQYNSTVAYMTVLYLANSYRLLSK